MRTKTKAFAYLFPALPVCAGYIVFRNGLPYNDQEFIEMDNHAYDYSDCIWFNEKFDCKYIYRTAESRWSRFCKIEIGEENFLV